MEAVSRELECGVCLEFLQDPKILDCSHTFCAPCIPGLVVPSTKNIKCPLCQRCTSLPTGGIAALKPNILARSMVDSVTSMNPDMVEVGQEATEPSAMSPAQRQPPPQRQPLPQRGHIAPALAMPTTCLAHPGQGLHFYCIECKLPICRDCTVIDHPPPKHTVSNIGNEANRPRAEIKDLADELKKQQEKYEQASQLIRARGEDFAAAADRAKNDISAAAEMVIADVRGKQQQLFDRVDFIAGSRKGAIEGHMLGIQEALDEVGITPKELDNLESKDDTAIVALHRRMQYGLAKMKQRPPPSFEVTDGLGFLKFSEEKTPPFNLHLGDLLEDEKWCLDLKFGKFGSAIGEFNCARGVVATPAGDMAVTEQRNNRTCIFSTDGKHKLTMSSGDPERGDRDVAFLPDGRCLVLCKTANIEVYDVVSGKHLNTIRTPAKNPWCFAVDQGGTIYLGDLKEKLIYVLVDGVEIRKFKVAHQPLNLEVDNKGHLMVSSAASKRVDVMSIATGDIIFTITSKSVDPSNMVSPWGACFGPNGSIFVPFYFYSKVVFEGSVHEFSPEGRHVGCVARGLQMPRRVGFTRDGRLIVVDGTSIKLFRKV